MIQWFAQEHPASCIATCLRMTLRGFGTPRTEPEIRELLGNPPYGLTLEQAAAKLSEHGAVAEWHADWGVDDLRDSVRDGFYPIVGVERRLLRSRKRRPCSGCCGCAGDRDRDARPLAWPCAARLAD